MNRITRYTPSRLPLSGRFENDFGFLWPVTRLQQEMNRLFSDTFRGLEEDGEENRGTWTFNPVVDVLQQDDRYEIGVELPGVIREDVNVEVTDDMLVISGSKERKQSRGEGQHRQSERVYGSFQRSFRLPEDADADNIRARFDDGVLTVEVPRDESKRQSQSRRIEIQRGTPAGPEPPQQGAGNESAERRSA